MEFLSGVGPFVPRNNGDRLLVDRSSKVKELERDEERKMKGRVKEEEERLAPPWRLQRSAEFFSRIRAKFLPGLLDDTEECRRRLVEWMAGMPTLLEESCSMTLHPDCLRPLWSMGVRLCAAWMSRVRIPFDGSSTQGFAGLCAWDMGIMDYRVFLGVVWGFERDIYIYRK